MITLAICVDGRNKSIEYRYHMIQHSGATMNTLTLPKRLGRLLRRWFRTGTPPASVDPYEEYKDRIPNAASRRALEEVRRGDLKTYDSVEELFADLDDE